jgi:hypothetical protein
MTKLNIAYNFKAYYTFKHLIDIEVNKSPLQVRHIEPAEWEII